MTWHRTGGYCGHITARTDMPGHRAAPGPCARSTPTWLLARVLRIQLALRTATAGSALPVLLLLGTNALHPRQGGQGECHAATAGQGATQGLPPQQHLLSLQLRQGLLLRLAVGVDALEVGRIVEGKPPAGRWRSGVSPGCWDPCPRSPPTARGKGRAGSARGPRRTWRPAGRWHGGRR